MSFHVVVKCAFEHRIDCFQTGQDERCFFPFKRGDVIEISMERKYVADMGWYFKVIINYQHSYFMAISDIERYYKQEKVCSLLDLELEMNFWKYQVDHALANREEKLFADVVNKLKKVKELYEGIFEKLC